MRKTNVQKAQEWGNSYGEAWARTYLKRAEAAGQKTLAAVVSIRDAVVTGTDTVGFLAENEYPVFIIRAKNDAVREAAVEAARDGAEDVFSEAAEAILRDEMDRIDAALCEAANG